jgi:hypothetical protein
MDFFLDGPLPAIHLFWKQNKESTSERAFMIPDEKKGYVFISD